MGGVCNIKAYYWILDYINKFNLDLTGITVLTEMASGPYLFTPFIALLSNAKRVFAVTKDSVWGKRDEIIKDSMHFMRFTDIKQGNLIIVKDKEEIDPSEVDIITNSGFVRPLNREFINKLRKGTVISLMWETWELRENEVDLASCIEKGIPVLGVNEDYPGVDTLRYLGLAVAKVLVEKGFAILDDTYVIVGDSRIGFVICETLRKIGAQTWCYIINDNSRAHVDLEQIYSLRKVDAIIVADHMTDEVIIGREGALVSSLRLKEKFPFIEIIVVTGRIDYEALKENNISWYPSRIPPEGYMALSAAYLGAKPVIALNTAGLKVGEITFRALKREGDLVKGVRRALLHPLVQDLTPFHKVKYKVPW